MSDNQPDNQQMDLFSGDDDQATGPKPGDPDYLELLPKELLDMDKIALVHELVATRRQAAADLRDAAAKITALQRQIDHLKISLAVFGNLTVVYGEGKEGPATCICPDCMHEHKLHSGPIEPGAQRSYRCPKCKGSVTVIFGFDGDQIIQVKERVSLQTGREMAERVDAMEAYARDGGD